MNRDGLLDFRLERLKNQIDELREILNAVCAASDGAGVAKEVLLLSQCLDGLIVEYMNRINKNEIDA